MSQRGDADLSEKVPRSEKMSLTLYRLMKTMYVFAPFLWVLTITLLTYPYLAPLYDSMGAIPRTEVLLGIAFTFLMILVTAFVVGYLYADVFKLYKPEHKIVWERNPYTASGLLSVNQVRHIEEVFIPLFEAQGNEERVKYLKDCVKAKELL
jgi:hypothetical protein